MGAYRPVEGVLETAPAGVLGRKAEAGVFGTGGTDSFDLLDGVFGRLGAVADGVFDRIVVLDDGREVLAGGPAFGVVAVGVMEEVFLRS